MLHNFFLSSMKKRGQGARVLLMLVPLILIAYETVRVIIGEDVMPIGCSLIGVLVLLIEAIRRRMCDWYLWTVLFLGLVSIGVVSGITKVVFGGALAFRLIWIWSGNYNHNRREKP